MAVPFLASDLRRSAMKKENRNAMMTHGKGVKKEEDR